MTQWLIIIINFNSPWRESAPYRVTADPGRGKDHPRPPAYQEMSQGPGQGLGNLYTWGCTSPDLYRQEVPSPGCWFLCSTMDTWWEEVKPAGRASYRAQCWADTVASRGELWDGERSQREAGRCTIISDLVTCS